MANGIVVQANGICLDKLMSYNTKFGVKVSIYIDGEFYCDICIPEKILFKALYEAYKKGAIVKFKTFEDSVRFHYFKTFKYSNNLSDSTMQGLIKLSLEEGKFVSISLIKDIHKQAGDKLENGFTIDLYKKFNDVGNILKDLKRAQREYDMLQAASENKLKYHEQQREI
jgi:hypothetical protein